MKKMEFIVLDCSITITWILPDDAMTEKATEILSSLDIRHVKVSTFWPLEVANVL